VGTTFSIGLPVMELPDAPADSGIAEVRAMPPPPSADPATVLVVEDDPATRERLRRGLTRGGLRVVEAEDGGAALDRLRDRTPGLILLDLLMPHVDGFQFIDRIAGEVRWRSIPVIVLTAKDITEEDRARLGGRVVKVLRKAELPGEELIMEVRRALQAADREPAAEAPPPGTRGRP
jgi:CheY-like chemotaxis protein